MTADAYTFADHGARCAAAARNREVLVQHVVCRRGKLVYCGVIKGCWTSPNGKECWTIETTWPEATRITVPVTNVAVCVGDTCSCVAACNPVLPEAGPDPEFSHARVVAPRDSLNFEKTSPSAQAAD